jgi:hypothetical protein
MNACRRRRSHFAWRRGPGCRTRCHGLRCCRSTRGSKAAFRTGGSILRSSSSGVPDSTLTPLPRRTCRCFRSGGCRMTPAAAQGHTTQRLDSTRSSMDEGCPATKLSERWAWCQIISDTRLRLAPSSCAGMGHASQSFGPGHRTPWNHGTRALSSRVGTYTSSVHLRSRRSLVGLV